jgi:hypothetical protein
MGIKTKLQSLANDLEKVCQSDRGEFDLILRKMYHKGASLAVHVSDAVCLVIREGHVFEQPYLMLGLSTLLELYA